MRGFDCVAPDGSHEDPVHLEAETDEGLAEQARGMVAYRAYDVEDE